MPTDVLIDAARFAHFNCLPPNDPTILYHRRRTAVGQ